MPAPKPSKRRNDDDYYNHY